ncbi:MAG: hypothetical protein RQ745_11225 [Longimicrobiales bacterium]|nr:hypothetical protein [Longimicrobiales bacterium]
MKRPTGSGEVQNVLTADIDVHHFAPAGVEASDFASVRRHDRKSGQGSDIGTTRVVARRPGEREVAQSKQRQNQEDKGQNGPSRQRHHRSLRLRNSRSEWRRGPTAGEKAGAHDADGDVFEVVALLESTIAPGYDLVHALEEVVGRALGDDRRSDGGKSEQHEKRNLPDSMVSPVKHDHSPRMMGDPKLGGAAVSMGRFDSRMPQSIG